MSEQVLNVVDINQTMDPIIMVARDQSDEFAKLQRNIFHWCNDNKPNNFLHVRIVGDQMFTKKNATEEFKQKRLLMSGGSSGGDIHGLSTLMKKDYNDTKKSITVFT